jgi:hypothetical protein
MPGAPKFAFPSNFPTDSLEVRAKEARERLAVQLPDLRLKILDGANGRSGMR